jgi:hypothetical protein
MTSGRQALLPAVGIRPKTLCDQVQNQDQLHLMDDQLVPKQKLPQDHLRTQSTHGLG